MRKVNSVQGSKYTDEDRRYVMATYLVVGNINKVSDQTGIPARTIHDWMKTEWWDGMITQARAEKDEELDANLTEIIHLASEQIKERIQYGDYTVGNGKEWMRKPMSGKDLALVQAIEYDKRALIRHAPTRISIAYTTQHLVEMQKQFEAIISTKTIEGIRVD